MLNDISYIYNHFDEVTSTNDVAWSMISEGASSFVTILSNNQTSGRGRHGNIWSCFGGNLYFSIIVKNIKNLNNIPFVTSVAVGETIKKVTGIKPSYKWPNDILLNNKKVSGVLIESKIKGLSNILVIGIGVNICDAPNEATFINKSLSKKITRDQFLYYLLKNFSFFLNESEDGRFESVRKIWLMCNKEKNVIIRTSKEKNKATLIDVNQCGKSIFKNKDGLFNFESINVF